MSTSKEDRIRQRAHAKWEQEGKPHGSDHRHWEEASREVDGEDETPAKPATRAKKAAKASAPGDKETSAPGGGGTANVKGTTKTTTGTSRTK